MAKFKDWFHSNLIVGAYPEPEEFSEAFKEYDIFINVSDEFRPAYVQEIIGLGKTPFWFPMNEIKKDIGLNSIYAAMCVLYHAEQKNKKVFLHCHAGMNRSPTIQACYHFMRTGQHMKQEDKVRGFINRLYCNSTRGYLPPMAEMEKFLGLIMECLQMENNTTKGLDHCKVGAINNF